MTLAYRYDTDYGIYAQDTYDYRDAGPTPYMYKAEYYDSDTGHFKLFSVRQPGVGGIPKIPLYVFQSCNTVPVIMFLRSLAFLETPVQDHVRAYEESRADMLRARSTPAENVTELELGVDFVDSANDPDPGEPSGEYLHRGFLHPSYRSSLALMLSMMHHTRRVGDEVRFPAALYDELMKRFFCDLVDIDCVAPLD